MKDRKNKNPGKIIKNKNQDKMSSSRSSKSSIRSYDSVDDQLEKKLSQLSLKADRIDPDDSRPLATSSNEFELDELLKFTLQDFPRIPIICVFNDVK